MAAVAVGSGGRGGGAVGGGAVGGGAVGGGATSRPLLGAAFACALLLGGCRLERLDGNGEGALVEPSFASQVEALLEEQAQAWNAGDLDGFMRGFHQSPLLTFVGSGVVLEGWDAVRANYAPRFEPGAARDSLRFEGLRAREIGDRAGVATARYVLERDGEVASTGPFTIVLESVEGYWRIVHDHSSPPEDAP